MSTNTEHTFSSVVSINPYKETYINGISSFLSHNQSAQYSKDQYAISYLNTNGFINTHIEITKNIPEEDLYDAINNKVYDELALDQAVEYQIEFIEFFNTIDEDNRHFHAFIIDPSIVKETFKNTIKAIKYIDTIIPSPLLLKSLYTKDIIEDNGVHVFIYFQENDASITIYNEQEFLYTKSIGYSFLQMHERFCELFGEQIEYSDFLNFFTNHNLKSSESDYKEYFIKLYKEIFANINDVLTYVKRAYELKKIDQIYIGSQVNSVTKLDEMSEAELGIKSDDFNFDYGFESDETYIDQLHALMHIYTTIPEEERYNCNFTTYFRPPKFIHRQSGKLILLVAASFIIAFIYPVSYWVLTYAQTLQYESLSSEYQELHNIKTIRQATIKHKQATKTKEMALLKIEKQEYQDKKNTLVKIHDVKVKYPMKAKLLSTLTKDLNRFNVKVQSLSYAEPEGVKVFSLNLVSSKDKRITHLVEYLTKKHEDKFTFSLEEIKLDESSKKYFSELKVSIL